MNRLHDALTLADTCKVSLLDTCKALDIDYSDVYAMWSADKKQSTRRELFIDKTL